MFFEVMVFFWCFHQGCTWVKHFYRQVPKINKSKVVPGNSSREDHVLVVFSKNGINAEKS